MSERALDVWGRKVARLPSAGTLLVCTDLQGNLKDYEAMKALQGPDDVLIFEGDLVHGPAEGQFLEFLGTHYVDQSRELLLDFERYTRTHRAFCLMGNHEHAHVGGPRVRKFHADEAAVLDETLGDEKERMHAFLSTFPLIAVGDGIVFTHGAPAATEPTLEDFEKLDYRGYEDFRVRDMYGRGTLGELLWARFARTESALDLLEVCTGKREGIVIFGHDIVRQGWVSEDPHQLCLSTSFGCFDEFKTYLRLDLSKHYRSATELGRNEILRLYP